MPLGSAQPVEPGLPLPVPRQRPAPRGPALALGEGLPPGDAPVVLVHSAAKREGSCSSRARACSSARSLAPTVARAP